MKNPLLACLIALALLSGARAAEPPAVVLKHFNHLYAEVEIGGRAMAVVHIYARHPDYRYAIEPNEGYACVDDVARALVMLVQEWQQQPEAELLRKIRRLTEFVLHLQNKNGYFNNFLWGDHSVNTRYKTSVAELNWWSLRALWSLEIVYPVLAQEPAFAERIRSATQRLVGNLARELLAKPRTTRVKHGITLPTWLPAESGADQAAEAIIGLLPHLRRTGSPQARRLVEAMADGVLLMQKGDATRYPHGMFLSWNQRWHAWGNVQAYALLAAGERLSRPDYVAAALREVEHFYPYLLKTGLAEFIEISCEGARCKETQRRPYPQIAYGIRPMVYAALKAQALTGDVKYRLLAERLSAWFTGDNDAATPMYDAKTGVVFDGIRGRGDINRNSGAESTVEALLTLQALRDGVP